MSILKDIYNAVKSTISPVTKKGSGSFLNASSITDDSGFKIIGAKTSPPDIAFYVEHSAVVDKYLDAAFEPWFRSLKTHIFSEKLQLTEMALANLIAFREYCMKYPGGQQYFNKINMHEKNGVTWSHYQRWSNILADMREHPEKYLKDEEVYLKEQNFDPYTVLSFIRENPGVLQKDLYKHFDPDLKSHIQSILYTFEKNLEITREKSGNTYKLFSR